MTDEPDREWATIVPPMKPLVADSLWAEWSANHAQGLSTADVRIDQIRANGGDLRRYRVRGREQPLTSIEVAERLRTRCSDALAIVDDHLDEWDGEILVTLLVADLRQHMESEFDSSGDLTGCGCIALLDTAIRTGDASVQNAVAVCFVEDACWWDLERQPFIDAWPDALRTEAERQRERTQTS